MFKFKKMGDDIQIDMEWIGVDYEFINLFDLELIQGRSFSREFSTDAREAIILNEAASGAFGLHYPFNEAIEISALRRNCSVIGIIKDFHYSSSLAILIACLGLFGLAAFIAQQRTREIGIRKVLGASVMQIVSMLSRGFLRWLAVANLIAWPIAWFAMYRWLQGFAYRTSIGLWTFVFSALLSLMIAVITVGYQSVRAASANPVKSLKYE